MRGAESNFIQRGWIAGIAAEGAGIKSGASCIRGLLLRNSERGVGRKESCEIQEVGAFGVMAFWALDGFMVSGVWIWA